MRSDLMSVDCLVITYSGMRSNISKSCTKAFVHAVMEGMMTLSQGVRGPTERGFAIDFLITVTP